METRNRRAMSIGLAAAGLILLYHFAIDPWLGHWEQVRAELTIHRQKIEMLQPRHEAAGPAIPAFAMPEKEDRQRLEFEREFNEQLQKAGLQITAMPQYLSSQGKAQPGLGVKLLQMQCRGKCNLAQALDLLAALEENPYYVAVEEFKLECGQQNRQEMELTLAVSTFCQ